MTNRLLFNVLGGFEAFDGARASIRLSNRKAQGLLAYLAIECTHPHSREHLATLLWARTGEERARHNLRQALSKLRQHCPDLITSHGDRIALNNGTCQVDARRFLDLARSDDPDDLFLALELYRGDLLEGYVAREPEYQEWLELTRGQLRKRAVEVAERLAESLIGYGREREAIDVLNYSLRIDAANESAHRELMLSLARQGRRSEALRQYQECVTALARQLNAEPGVETKRLHDDIRRGTNCTLEGAMAPDAEAPSGVDFLSSTNEVQRFAAVLYAENVDAKASREQVDVVHVPEPPSDVGATTRQCIERLRQLGGALQALFEDPNEALACALRIQSNVVANPNEAPSRFRIGIDCGDLHKDDGGFLGDAVEVARRLEALVPPNGICVSGRVRDAVKVQGEAAYQFIGEQRVSQVDYPVRAYRVVSPDLLANTAVENQQKGGDPTLPLPGKPSLVVRPFANMSKDAEQDYFAEGLTKDISIALTKIPGLFLAEDGSPLEQASRGMDIAELRRTFAIRYVLTGGVRRHGMRVRVNAELIDATTGQCLWGERFDRELHDLFAIQDEIAEEIVTAMDVKLLQGEDARFMRSALTDPRALDASYRGWYALYHGTGRQDVLAAQRLFEDVIRLEPQVPLGYASAALAYWAEAGFGRVVVNSSAMERSAQLACKALELGDTTGYAHLIMALVHLANHEYEDAMAQATDGVAARPNCNGAYAIKASVLNFLGRSREAIEFAQYAVRLTPVYPAEFPAVLAAAYHDSGRYTEAIAAAEASLKLRDDDIDPMLFLAASYVALEQVSDARQIAARIRQLEPTFRLTEFAKTQPYRVAHNLERLIDRLREAGLPE